MNKQLRIEEINCEIHLLKKRISKLHDEKQLLQMELAEEASCGLAYADNQYELLIGRGDIVHASKL